MRNADEMVQALLDRVATAQLSRRRFPILAGATGLTAKPNDISAVCAPSCGPRGTAHRKSDAPAPYFRQPIKIGAQHAALQDKVCEFAFANDLDQARGFEFLNVDRRESWGRQCPGFACRELHGVGASCSPISLRDPERGAARQARGRCA